LSLTAVALVLAAAIAHASWNLFGKQAAATGAACFIWLLAVGVTGIYLPVVAVTAFVTHPRLAGLNWLFLAGTGVLHAGYFLFLQLGYRLGDLSVGYPIGRGTGAMLAALAGILLLGERPSLLGGAGILAIVAGVVVIGLPQRRAHGAESVAARADGATAPPAQPDMARTSAAGAIAFALVTGVFIACYTIWDKYAVATLHTEPVLQGRRAVAARLHPGADRAQLHRGQRGRACSRGERPVRRAARQEAAGRGQRDATARGSGRDRGGHHRGGGRLTQ
jgi:drug/metabolite transporter (DMT)-like permease